ncbi:MAG: glutamine amidotransferase [Planctomycetota bacterium]|jgi:GMP synthase (glutamine-hydrolysing)|nr:glutamine amidotransferase [Planctomycetota bacterium]
MNPASRPVVLLQTGDTPPAIRARVGNFDRMFFACPGWPGQNAVRVHVQAGERPGRSELYRAAVITGSHDMVTDAPPWSEWLAGWLARAFGEGLPLFGVCYGHQLLARALGGRVGYLPGGPELGTMAVSLTEKGKGDPLLAGYPPAFAANLAHSQTVLEPPPEALVLGGSIRDPHQILGYGSRAWGVQFHPEFDREIMLTYLDYFAPSPAVDSPPAGDTPEVAELPGRFLELFEPGRPNRGFPGGLYENGARTLDRRAPRQGRGNK